MSYFAIQNDVTGRMVYSFMVYPFAVKKIHILQYEGQKVKS